MNMKVRRRAMYKALRLYYFDIGEKRTSKKAADYFGKFTAF